MDPLHDVRIDRRADELILVLCGEIDSSAAGDVGAQGRLALAERPGRLLLDLSEVTFLDSAGVGAIVRLRNRAVDQGLLQLELRPGPPNVMRVLEMVGLTGVFEGTG